MVDYTKNSPGAPVGSYVRGDICTDSDGTVWVCTATGNPAQFEAETIEVQSNGRVWAFRARTTSVEATDPGTGLLKWDDTPQTDALNLYVDDVTDDGIDISAFVPNLTVGATLLIQARGDATQFQLWEVSGTPTDNTGWWTIPVTLSSSGGAAFSNNQRLIATAEAPAAAGGAPTPVVVTESTVLDAADSGTTYLLDSGTAIDMTLPAPAAGLYFKFVVTAALSGNYRVLTAGAASIINGWVIGSHGSSVDYTRTNASEFRFGDGGAEIGDWAEFYSDGNIWSVCGMSRFIQQ